MTLRATVPALERLRGLRVVADPAALDGARWSGERPPTGPPVGDVTVFRFAPDEAFAIGARHVDIDDEHAIVEEEHGFVGAWYPAVEAGALERHIEWPVEGGMLAQGSIAGVPAKLLRPRDEDRVLVVTAAAYRHELEVRLGWRS